MKDKKLIHFLFRYLFLISVGFYVPTIVIGAVKDIGVPVIQNFERAQYNAGTQNWSISQGINGVMYFGNNQGLLRYDGQFWSTFKVPNGSNIRCVQYSKKQDLLYVGSFNELGFFTYDSIGSTAFTSLKELVPDDYKHFGDVWRIHETPSGVVFQTFEAIFIYHDGKIDVVPPRSIFHFSYYVNGILYVFDRDNGFMEYRNGFLKKIPGGDFFTNREIWSVLPLNNDEILIGTSRDGLFVYNGLSITPWKTPVNELLKEHQIYSSIVIDEQHFAFGTIQNGLIICNREGEIKQLINREKGLQNNTILSMYLDLDENLWLGLDNGIDYVELNSPITLLQDYYDFGTGYTSINFNDKIYLGTNQGLFYCNSSDFKNSKLSSSDFKMVENTSGQVWNLQIIEDQLYCGHNNGSFLIKENKGILLNNSPGCWAYTKIPGSANLYIEGTYSGMELCKIENGIMKHLYHIKGINYSCQELECIEEGKIWVSHAFKGVSLFQLKSNSDSLVLIKKYEESDGLPSTGFNKIKKMTNGDILLSTPVGIYQYNSSSDIFYKSKYYNNLLHDKPIQYLQEDENNNIWYVCSNGEGGVLRYQEDGTFFNVSYPFNKLKGRFIGSFFNFNIMDDSNVLIALEKGYAHYNPKMIIDYRRGYHAVLNSVSLLRSNNVLYNGVWHNDSTGKQAIIPEIEFQNNSLRFTFTGLFFEGNNETKFSYFLEGFDSDWSEWQFESTKEYTNLPDGDYTFRVKSKNKYDVIASPSPYQFIILPPWFKSTKAIIAYFIITIIFIWFWIFLFIKRVEKLRRKEVHIQKKNFEEKEERLKREALEAEKEIIRLRNDKLRANMIHKDKELANSAMNLVQKNKQLNSIKGELKKIQSELKEELVKSRLGTMVRKIEKETNNDESWKIFETNFEQVHEEFLKRIKDLHPDITPKELKLAAYLRMNISSKEIATLMNITTRGVEISRYRLRRKFDLDRAQNLTDYILSV